MPIAMADHVPTQAPYGTNASDDANAGTFTIGILGSDGFEDSPPESYTIFFSQSSGVTETNSFCVTTSFGHSANTWQYHTFSLDNLKYYFNNPAGTNIYYRVRSNNITDYSFSTLTDENTWNLYAGAPFDYNQTDWSAPTGDSACDDPKILDGIGDPSNLTTSANLHDGSITIDWDAAPDRYEYSAERYAIGFDKANPTMYGIATGNVGDENALNTEYTFSKSYLQSVLDAQVGDTLYFEIRADNDTNSQYSNWTSIASYTIPDVASGVTDLLITNNEYQGLKLGWTQPNTGWSAVESYRIEYKLSSEETYTGIDIADPNTTSYLIEDIEGGTYDFVVYSCTDSGSFCHGGQAGPVTNFEVLATTAVTTTTTTTTPTTLPPPPPPPAPTTTLAPVEVVVMDDGTEAEYTQDQISQGDVERDNERKANEDKWGCYVTNVALERGDCDAYNKALYESTTTTTIPETKEEDVIVEEEIIIEEEEIIDEKPIPEDEIPITEDEIIIEDEILDDFEDIVTDGDLVEDDVKEPVKEEIVDEEIIDEEPIDDKPIEIIEKDEPIKEDFPDEEEIEIIETDPLPSEEGDTEVQLTDEEIEELVTETEEAVKEIVVVKVVEEVLEEDATEEEIQAAQEEFEAAVEEVVKELPKEKKIEVVKEIAKVKVQNLATADNTTKAVVKAVVKEVTKPETVAELTEDEKKEVGKVLGFKDEETAAKDVEIIAEQATKEENIATAVNEYVDRAIENKDVENYTLADTVTEVQVEAFLENPVGSLLDVKIDELDISSIGQDMTSDQREKAQEVVVPVIIASQIISSAGALMRRF